MRLHSLTNAAAATAKTLFSFMSLYVNSTKSGYLVFFRTLQLNAVQGGKGGVGDKTLKDDGL